MAAAEQDFNDLLDNIVLAEENIVRESYEEGLEVGRTRGEQEGYELGYAQGIQLGKELGEIYGTVVAQQQQKHSEKVQRALQQLRASIDQFPRDNNPEADIIGMVENIRMQYKRVRVLTAGKVGKTTKKVEDNSSSTSGAAEKAKDFSF
ncbi:protein LTO1 homolog [Zeugodacus cucurbitae]|uniref:protein LTO1 homolog n=1 Tax=Zeugodacus cucurbitae TaxID=28588 RepID=UPI000596AA0A|nr:protein LTO1 homolog [Zeugodacus cucurbitae]